MPFCSRCIFLFAVVLSIEAPLYPYQAATQPPVAAAAAPADPILTAAGNLVGKALFLRGFYASNNLSYDAAGKLTVPSGVTDWTLAAVDVRKATRPRPGAIELDGIRVAIRYNPDAHEFQRHPQNDQPVKILVELTPPGTDAAADARVVQAAFAAMFSVGIDPALQHSMPAFWRHYFDPGLAWPPDALASETIYPMPPLPPLPGPAVEVVPPILSHQTSSQLTPAARRDKVQGPVQVRLVVDAEGMPQRIAITRPLGYGLDQQAAEAVAQWRFNPALHAGKPIASAILINIDFVVPPAPR